MAPRHTFTAGDTTFTVNARYQPLSGLGRYRLGSELAVAVGDKITGENRVIRKFSNVDKQLSEARRCLREIRFLRHFKGHDNIARICDIDVNFHSNGDFNEVYLIEAYCATDFRKIIRWECPLADNEIRAFAHQILRGVGYIHSAGVVLQDLTPENIFVSEEGAVKIGALGSPDCSVPSNNIFDERPVHPYQAPELSLGYGDLSPAANVWSVGCIIMELLTGVPIFGATDFRDHIRGIFGHTGFPSGWALSALGDPNVREYVRSIGSVARVPLVERYKDADPRLLDFVSKMLILDINGRITCKTALLHKYLDDVRTYADGFTCFPYKGSLEEDLSSIPEVKAQLVKELRSFYALQYDNMVDISLPQLDFGQDFKSDSLSLPPPSQPSASESPISREELNLSAAERAEDVQSPEPPATISGASTRLERKKRSDKPLFWSRLRSTFSRFTIHDSDAHVSSFRNGPRQWTSPRRKGLSATRDFSVDIRPPSLSLGVKNIGEDFGRTMRSGLEDNDISIQRTPNSRRASTMVGFISHLDGRGENGHGKVSQNMMDLTRELRKESDHPRTGGAFSDIWRCYWFRDSEDPGPELVAVKVMKTNVLSDKVKEKRRFHRELGVWRQLDHKNIVPLYGTAYGFGFYPAMVCPWASKGSLNQYLHQCHGMLSRAEKFQVLDDVASGLEYLHKNHVTHGDLTGSNVLIFDGGRARLTDFGMSAALKDLWGSSYFTESTRGAFRWAAPELLDEGYIGNIGPACDIYSFGSIILQVLSGKVPYFYLDSDTQVLGMVVQGMNPERPRKPSIDDEEWDIIQWCWTRKTTDRPEIGEVAEALKSLVEVNPLSRDLN